jgi:hypothetical protein
MRVEDWAEAKIAFSRCVSIDEEELEHLRICTCAWGRMIKRQALKRSLP